MIRILVVIIFCVSSVHYTLAQDKKILESDNFALWNRALGIDGLYIVKSDSGLQIYNQTKLLRTITLDFNDTNIGRPVWSPNGDKIAFYLGNASIFFESEHSEQIILYNLNNDEIQLVSDFKKGSSIDYTISWVKNKIYFSGRLASDYDYGLYSIDLESLSVERIRKIKSETTFIGNANVSPNERYLVYEEDETWTENRSLYLIDLELDTKTQITSDNFDSYSSWSHDSKYIAFSRFERYESGSSDIYIYSLENKELKKITGTNENEDLINNVDYSPNWLDVNYIIFNRYIGTFEDIENHALNFRNTHVFEIWKIPVK